MSEIPSISYSEFKHLTPDLIRQMQSVEVTDDKGQYFFTAIVPQTDFIRGCVTDSAIINNSVGGKLPSELMWR
jgi:hypothetical protein